jgi:hypothetical protein
VTNLIFISTPKAWSRGWTSTTSWWRTFAIQWTRWKVNPKSWIVLL